MTIKHASALALTAGAFLVGSASAQASDDSRIEKAIKESYNYKTYLRDDHIHVKSRDGIVTLTGTVLDDQQRQVSADTAASEPGVANVNNELKVKGEQPAEHSDGWLAFKVKSALAFHRNVSATDTQVNVHDNIVTLTGVAKTAAQKDLTTEYAKDVEGVRSVDNQMRVQTASSGAGAPVIESAGAQNGYTRQGETAGEKIDDASITARVKSTLLTHNSTSAVNTKVKTTDGNVVVSGVARNQAEKDLVGKLVSDINGVRNVDNEMTVESGQ